MIGLKERALIDSLDDLSVRMVNKSEMTRILTESFTYSVARSPIELSLIMIMIDHAMSF